MRDVLNIVLKVSTIVAMTFGLAWVGYYYACEFLGYDTVAMALQSSGISLNDGQITTIGIVSMVVMVVSYFVRKKFLN